MGEREPVHVFAVWNSGPRSGLADYRGHPHLFESLWRDEDQPRTAGDLALVPVPESAVATLLAALRPVSHDPAAPTLYPAGGDHHWAFGAAWAAFRTAALAAEVAVVLADGEMGPRSEVSAPDWQFDPLAVEWTTAGVTDTAAVRERLAELDRRRAAWRPSSEVLSSGEDMPF